MMTATPENLNALLPTREERDFIRQHIGDDVAGLALLLSKHRLLDAGRVIRQVQGLQIVAKKGALLD